MDEKQLELPAYGLSPIVVQVIQSSDIHCHDKRCIGYKWYIDRDCCCLCSDTHCHYILDYPNNFGVSPNGQFYQHEENRGSFGHY